MTQTTALNILKLGHTTFLTGAAGSGKSYVLREYVTYLRRHGIKYAVTASTGIAATHVGGTTIHAWSGVGIKHRLTSYDIEALEEKQPVYKRWNDVSVLIIDEVSMLHASFLDMVNRVGKQLRRNDKPFGGIQVIFCGDFFQLPPVVKGDEAYESGHEVHAFTSDAWKESKPVVCYLTEQFRQDDDKLLSILGAIRSGDFEEDHFESLQATSTKKHTEDHIKLYTHNINVDEINQKAYEKIPGEEYVYEMITKGKATLVESLKNNCLAEEFLSLKKGAKVICIKNDAERKYVNGSMGIVIDFDKDRSPIVELASGKRVTITADTWRIEEDGKVKAELCQLPLKLAWAITVHKSQGMTLDRAEIDLSRAFASGQGYVALSRLRSLEGLYLVGMNPQAFYINEDIRTQDDVFRGKSEQAERALEKYDERRLEELHQAFVTSSGGSVEELSDDVADEIAEKTPSHTITQTMLADKQDIHDIADKRNLSEDTIIGHIEKLVEAGEDVVLGHVLPAKKDCTKIRAAFQDLDTHKLTPIFEHLKGAYTYHQIRLVRASLSAKK